MCIDTTLCVVVHIVALVVQHAILSVRSVLDFSWRSDRRLDACHCLQHQQQRQERQCTRGTRSRPYCRAAACPCPGPRPAPYTHPTRRQAQRGRQRAQEPCRSRDASRGRRNRSGHSAGGGRSGDRDNRDWCGGGQLGSCLVKVETAVVRVRVRVVKVAGSRLRISDRLDGSIVAQQTRQYNCWRSCTSRRCVRRRNPRSRGPGQTFSLQLDSRNSTPTLFLANIGSVPTERLRMQ